MLLLQTEGPRGVSVLVVKDLTRDRYPTGDSTFPRRQHKHLGRSRMDIAAVLSATAASVAAILAGLNLVVAGRREDRRWARETATEAFVAYMDASFESGSACRDAGFQPRRHLDRHALVAVEGLPSEQLIER